jgi:hypothetical protein
MQSEHKTFHNLRKPIYVNFSLLALLQSEMAKSFSFARWPFFFLLHGKHAGDGGGPADSGQWMDGEGQGWPTWA